MTQKRQGTGKLGWCLDALHDSCWQVTVSGLRCSCSCHGEAS